MVVFSSFGVTTLLWDTFCPPSFCGLLNSLMLIKVKAKPRSKKEEVKQISENYYEVRVSVPPEKGKANERIAELLADYFKVPKSAVKLVRGETSKEKLFEVKL